MPPFDPFAQTPGLPTPPSSPGMGGPQPFVAGGSPSVEPPPDIFANDAQLLKIFEQVKKECLDSRWVWEREWLRDIYYILNRQWIVYHPTRREWVDKRLHKWVPKPVTNKMKEILGTIRTTLSAIDLTAKIVPVGSTTKAIAAAEVADMMSPLIHEEHSMGQVMREADFWLIVTGSSCLQVSWERDVRYNRSFIQFDQCLQCGTPSSPKDLVANDHLCPQCGGNQFEPAKNPDGTPMGETISFGRGKTHALSPFEYAFPAHFTRFDEIPYILRMRWRDKSYFTSNFPDLVPKITFEKSPNERSLQLYKSLALTNDLGQGSNWASLASSGTPDTEGVTEYEAWIKPTQDFPLGAVIRVIGDKSPVLLRVEDEAVPGPFPYKDIEGRVIFPFGFAQYEHVGGRLWGSSALAPLIQKQDQLNQLDSLIQLIIQRMANPIWIIPEGAGIDKFSGEPGFVLKWNPLQAGGGSNIRPDRISGAEVPSSLWNLRQQLLDEIESLSGAYDILKGQKPAGVEAFSALQLLVERSQSRFGNVFASRGEMYKKWLEVAIELERQFGPDERVMTVIGPNKSYAFRHFQNAQLQGHVEVKIEAASNQPKTALGKRAAIEQATTMGLIDTSDPEQKYALLSQFGLSDLTPTLNVHVQAALQMQDEFEQWMEQATGMGGVGTLSQPQMDPLSGAPAVDPLSGAPITVPPQTPLTWKPWMDPTIHWMERVKWLNTDKMKEAMQVDPALEEIIYQHLAELQIQMLPSPLTNASGQPGEPPPDAPGGPNDPNMQGPEGNGQGGEGRGRAMKASNRNSGSSKAGRTGSSNS